MYVMKFGGTSVADPEAILRLTEIVQAARTKTGAPPAVVVSAMSGVTDALLTSAADAVAARFDDAAARLHQLRERHLAAAAALAAPGAAAALTSAITLQFDQLESVARGLSILREATPRTMDAIVAAGELLSSRIVAAAFEARGLPAAWLDPRSLIVTDEEFTRAAP